MISLSLGTAIAVLILVLVEDGFRVATNIN